MEKTIVNFEPGDKRAVDTKGLQQILGVGRKTATDIGMAAGARIQFNRRVLWNVAKIQKFLDLNSESE